MKEEIKFYWNKQYHKESNIPKDNSSFAEFVVDSITYPNIGSLIDLGCGNGRDTKYFEKKFESVVGYDFIEHPNYLANKKNLIIGDIDNFEKLYDIYYMRFFVHAIPESSLDKLLLQISKNKESIVCIETRSSKEFNNEPNLITNFKSPIGDKHFRILYSKDYLKSKVEKYFNIDYITEVKGLAIYKDDDPYIIRIICSSKK